jgi:hypothetical protein
MEKEERAMEKNLKSNVENAESNAKNEKRSVKGAKIKGRFGSVDNVRGLLVLLFLAAHTWGMGAFDSFVPRWMVHEGSVAGVWLWEFFNFSLMDLGPTAFFFVLGLTAFSAFSVRVARDGKKAAMHRYIHRNVLFLSLCFMMLYVGAKLNGEAVKDWDNINGVAFTGLLLAPFVYVDFIREKPWVRLLSGAAILALYHIFKAQIDVLSGHAGGVAACVGYAGFTLIVSFIGDVSREKGRKGVLLYLLTSVGIAAAAFLANEFLGRASYPQYNTTYMLMSLMIMNTIWFLFCIVDKLFIKNRPIPVVAAIGRSLIFFTVLSWILAPILSSLAVGIAPNGAVTPATLVIVELIGFAVYAAIGFVFDRKKIIIKL